MVARSHTSRPMRLRLQEQTLAVTVHKARAVRLTLAVPAVLTSRTPRSLVTLRLARAVRSRAKALISPFLQRHSQIIVPLLMAVLLRCLAITPTRLSALTL